MTMKSLVPWVFILLGQLGQLTNLKSAANNLNPGKPEFLWELHVDERSLEI
jgi:hypothetical protein